MKKLKGLLSAFLGSAVLICSAVTAFADYGETSVSETSEISEVTETSDVASTDTSAETSEPQTKLETEPSVDFYAPSVGLNISEHSRDLIRKYINGHPFDMTRQPEYLRVPDAYMPFNNIGRLSDTDLIEGRNALNVVRFIAGVGTQDVTLCSYATTYSQACAVVLRYKGYLTHTIYNDMPKMNIDTLRNAQLGAKNCNEASGFTNSAHSVVLGYMFDTDDRNIGELGHRRWCLNPPMYLAAFGQAGEYTAMWTTDKQLKGASNSGICWPAPNMPVEYFRNDTAWSISMCEKVPADNIKVTLTRKSDMRVWEFSNEHSDGYFAVNNDTSVPLYGCIIFRPDDVGGYSHGDVFNVKIEGLDKEVCYNVNFFALDGDDSVFDKPAEEPEESEPETSEPAESEPQDSEPAESEPADSDTETIDPQDGEQPAEEHPENKTTFEVKDEETNIQIVADPHVFPERTEFKAKPLGSYCSDTRYTCDLSFICGGQKVQPTETVYVTITLPNGMKINQKLNVYHVANARCCKVDSNYDPATNSVSFYADSFSPYIVTTEEIPEDEVIDIPEVKYDEETSDDSTSDGEESNPAESVESGESETSTTSESSEEPLPTTRTAPEPTAEEVETSTETHHENSANPNTGAAWALIPISAVATCAVLVTAKRKHK